MLKAYRYRIYPNNSQKEMFEKHFGCVRFVYNYGLQRKIEHYTGTGKSLSCFDLNNELVNKLKKEYVWLKEVNSQSLQRANANLDNAFTSFFHKGGKFPKFKSKKNKKSFQCPQLNKVDFERQKLSIIKIPNIKIDIDRTFEGNIKAVTISKTNTDKYYASILVDDGKELPEKVTAEKDKSVGIDLGIKDFAILSTGEKISNPKHYKKSEKGIKRAHKNLSRKKKGSNNWKKAKKKLALKYEKVTNQRRDFLHKLSTRLIRENQAVCLEDLNVSGMMKNHKLAGSIGTSGWYEFRRQLEYKSNWYGKEVRVIGRFEPSSKICSICGKVNHNLELKDREWVCSNCQTVLDRDVNAARNILNFAFTDRILGESTVGDTGIKACGDCISPKNRKVKRQRSKKQEVKLKEV